MSKKLLVLGGGDMCTEILWAIAVLSKDKPGWELGGVLDDRPDAVRKQLAAYGTTVPVLGTIRDHQPKDDEVFFPAIGNPFYKLATAELIEARGGAFINLIHPTAIIAPDAKLGIGIFCFINCVISTGAQVEDFVALNIASVAGHHTTLGRGSTLGPGCVLCGHASLERGVFVGANAAILPGKSAGEFSTIGAGSVPVSFVAAGMTVAGIPARPTLASRPTGAGVKTPTACEVRS